MNNKYTIPEISKVVDGLNTNTERLVFLSKVEKDIERALNCFSRYGSYNLRNLAGSDQLLGDECPEFRGIIKSIIKKNSVSGSGGRTFNNENIFHAVKEKITSLDRVKNWIMVEIDLYRKAQAFGASFKRSTGTFDNLGEDNLLENIKNEFDKFEKKLENQKRSSQETRKIKPLKKIKWKGTEDELDVLLESLYTQGLLPKALHEQKDKIKIQLFDLIELNTAHDYFEQKERSSESMSRKGKLHFQR